MKKLSTLIAIALLMVAGTGYAQTATPAPATASTVSTVTTTSTTTTKTTKKHKKKAKKAKATAPSTLTAVPNVSAPVTK